MKQLLSLLLIGATVFGTGKPDISNSASAELEHVYTNLASINPSERAEGLKCLFKKYEPIFCEVNIVVSQNNILTYAGTLMGASVPTEMLILFRTGTFFFERESSLFPGKSLLVLGRDTAPTNDEYEKLYIPRAKVPDFLITSAETKK